jgi:predicted AlkP superfamily pyrophosphatase or phosphodiesterase
VKQFLKPRRIGIWFLLFVLHVVATGASAQTVLPVIAVPNPPNAATQQSKPYVVLVSLDGFRYDYAERYGAKNLLALARRGASAPQGMIPSYPSITFPNHYTIVTGLYPEHHGIVANIFYDPARKERYAFNDQKTLADGTWYGGTPLWVLAEKQGMRAASFFWPGSEAEIQGKRPSYYLTFDDKLPDEQRVDQILTWLRLPPDQRPHFITLYYANVDHAGHSYGPEAPETAEAVRHVDDLVGKLDAQLSMLRLPIDLIVVSDHGMELTQGGWITLDKWADLSHFETAGPLLYAPSEADAEKAYKSLLGVSNTFKAYRQAELPKELHHALNPRDGNPVVVLTGPYNVVAHEPRSNGKAMPPSRGSHGYDPTMMPSMKAIFYAAGPDIRPGVVLPPFENIHVYPLIAKILGLRVGQIDGRLSVLQGILQERTQPSTQGAKGPGTSAGVRFDFFPPAP